ncbi:hypothetical protein E3T28_07155 [Cryobacterium sinapicolor]|uniref:Uncharacterized protein n=1 Tax=Cryobacterium sinapicolor TaxID=1259236 RepID=A0ABY2JCB9_9MICO|nr:MULTISPECIES: hypothetical protein [Cryobacterium]TFC92177.1 hypothetical protein E3O67_03615 [Cryobacterium sp. TMT3-29-2]TFD01327.1 hypothetical protein E3T28_07155 [Cryobacterium sinapicolor]
MSSLGGLDHEPVIGGQAVTISVDDEIGEVIPVAVLSTLILSVLARPYPVKSFLGDIEFAPVNMEAVFIRSGLTTIALNRGESLCFLASASLNV